MMTAVEKLEVLKNVYNDADELDRLLSKLLESILIEYQHKEKHYERSLAEFEERYQMDSRTFYERFENGKLGDAMDYFEWAGLYELFQDIRKKINSLERSF